MGGFESRSVKIQNTVEALHLLESSHKLCLVIAKMKVGEPTVRYQIDIFDKMMKKTDFSNLSLSVRIPSRKYSSVEQKCTKKSMFGNVLAKTLQKFEIM